MNQSTTVYINMHKVKKQSPLMAVVECMYDYCPSRASEEIVLMLGFNTGVCCLLSISYRQSILVSFNSSSSSLFFVLYLFKKKKRSTTMSTNKLFSCLNLTKH